MPLATHYYYLIAFSRYAGLLAIAVAMLFLLNPTWTRLPASPYVSVLLLGIGLSFLRIPRFAWLSKLAGWAVIGLAVLALLKFILLKTGVASVFIVGLPTISRPCALGVTAMGIAILLLNAQGPRAARWHRAGQWSALIACGIVLLTITAYVYQDSRFYFLGQYATPAVGVSLLYLLIAVGILCARPHAGWVSLLTADNNGGGTLRRLLPVALLVPIALGALWIQGVELELYGGEFGIALLVLANAFVFSGFLWQNARRVATADTEREREKRNFQSLAEHLPHVVFRVDTKLRYVYVSPAVEALTQIPPTSFLGKTAAEVGLPPSCCSLLQEKYEALFASNTRQIAEFTFPAASGPRHFVATLVPELDADGKIETILVVAIDVTQQKEIVAALQDSVAQAERERQQAERLAAALEVQLKEVEERQRTLDALMEHIPTGITIADAPDARIRAVSRYGLQLAGMAGEAGGGVPSDFPITAQMRIMHADGVTPARPEQLPITRAVKNGEVVRSEEWVVMRADGSKVPVLCSAGPIRDRGGKVIGAVDAWHDIGHQKLTEVALRRSEEMLMRAQQVANIGSFEYDLLSADVRWSTQLYAIFGLNPSEFTPKDGKTFEYVPPEDRQKIQQAFETALVQNVPYRVEHRILRPDGEERMVLTQGEIVARDEDGKATRVVGTVLDITQQHKTEEELRKAQKLESLGVLAGGIAHDFNNILTALFGNIALAKLYPNLQPGVRDALTNAEEAFVRARDLTQQLLTFSRGGAPICETASIPELLTETVEFVLRGANTRVEFAIASDLWPARVDKGQISQAINNLAINAKEAMAEGGHLRIEARNTTLGTQNPYGLAAGRYIELCFEDSGAGIPERYLAQIFDPYFTTKQGGSGLGLATTYSIIKRHQGHITVASKLGAGTTFTIYLPATEDAVVDTAQRDPAVLPGKGRILLMDDEAPVRKVGAALLTQLGYEVEEAHDSQDAIRLYEQAMASMQPYAAAILDLTVPGGISGKECLARLKELNPHIKALVSSGYSNDPVVAEYHAHGFAGVVPKPYQLADLSNALAALLREPQLRVVH